MFLVQGISFGVPEIVMLDLKGEKEMRENWPGKGYAVGPCWGEWNHKRREQQMYRS